MRYLLDTNVVSALRVRGREPQVQAWAAAIPVAAVPPVTGKQDW